MIFKLTTMATIVGLVKGGYINQPISYAAAVPFAGRFSAPIARTITAPLAYTASIEAAHEEYDPNPQYSFGYDVQDAVTGDSKNHVETRSGDVVRGSYSLNDPDGTRRIVEYTADPINGFNAVVRKVPLVAATPVVSDPIAAAAAPVAPGPVVVDARTAPVAYTAPSSIAQITAPSIVYQPPSFNYEYHRTYY